MRTASLLLASTFAITALSAGPALAERQSYPGAACHPTGSATGITRNEAGQLRNSGSSATAVICPLVVSTEVPVDARIYVRDMRNNGSVVCRRQSVQSDGDRIDIESRSSGGDIGDAVVNASVALDFTATTLSVNGAVSVTCDIPAKGPDGESGINVYLGYD
jgi:hypothetical protein